MSRKRYTAEQIIAMLLEAEVSLSQGQTFGQVCTTMKANDVTATLQLALAASSCDRANVFHKPRLLSDNGYSYISGDLAAWLEGQGKQCYCPLAKCARAPINEKSAHLKSVRARGLY